MDQDLKPAISVIMPVYNAEAYVREAMESIIRQTFRNFELLIINDGSTDRCEEIILSFADTRIRYIKNKRNLGIIKSRNTGLNLARGTYVAMLDADDISFPDRLEKQLHYMVNNPSTGVCGSKMEYTGAREGTFGAAGSSLLAFTQLMAAPPFGQSTALIRKSVLDTFSLQYHPDYPHAEDYKFWLDISKHTGLFCLSETLVCYRWHASNDSLSNSRLQEESSLKIQKEWFEYVLCRRLNGHQAGFFTGSRPSVKDILSYNLLCLRTCLGSSVPVDPHEVMKRRIQVNRRFLATRTPAGTLLRYLFSIADQAVSSIVLQISSKPIEQ